MNKIAEKLLANSLAAILSSIEIYNNRLSQNPHDLTNFHICT